jgi:hypothetical protein
MDIIISNSASNNHRWQKFLSKNFKKSFLASFEVTVRMPAHQVCSCGDGSIVSDNKEYLSAQTNTYHSNLLNYI